MAMDRRTFVKVTGGAAIAGMTLGFPNIVRGAGKNVVIVGGGTGGATAAKYLRLSDPTVKVTLIEASKAYYTCYFSNEVLAGVRPLESIRFSYKALEGYGINVINDVVTFIDAANKRVFTRNGASLDYERLIVAPGIDFKWELVPGYNKTDATRVPHAWQAGVQTQILLRQLNAMPDGGRVILVPPTNPFRCPPGPYERASQIARYLKKKKPKSKILILDQKDKFSKQGLFKQAWERLYGFGTENSMIEWVGASAGGKISRIDTANRQVITDFDTHKADVLNVIPPQKAGPIAFRTGLTKGDWCPVNKQTFESLLIPGIHVIGDSASAAKMPKSGYAANSQAKIAAAAVSAMINGIAPPTPTYFNTCYSIAGDDYAFSVAAVYRYDAASNTILPVKGSGGLTPANADLDKLKLEALYAQSWYNNITKDSFG